jgi:2-C-methyl-D-erythritol 2,4-cyclodiphosphate synthase
MKEFKIGFGYDIHRLAAGRKLIIGGVKIAFSKGLLGHSDADVLIHAICDALLGALGRGDIGEMFPNTDSAYKDISSIKLLKDVAKLMRNRGFCLVNLDTLIILEKPKISGYKNKMRENIARLLNTDKNNVNIKAGTNEGLGAIGQNKAIAAFALAAIAKGAGK